MNARLFIVTFFATVVLASIFMFVDNVYAFIATSTNFTVYQVISGITGSSTFSWSTSSNFMEVGDSEAVTGSSTGTNFVLNSGLLWDIVGEKNAASSSASLTFTVDSNTESFPALSPGILVATTSILSVTTNSSTGYNVTVSRNDVTGTMSKSGTYIPDATAWSPGANCTLAGNAMASTTSTYEPTLEFRVRQNGTTDYCSAWWGSDDTTANALFAGIPATAAKIITRSSATSGADVSTVLYNLDAPTIQPTGTYSGGITYTASTGP